MLTIIICITFIIISIVAITVAIVLLAKSYRREKNEEIIERRKMDKLI